MKGLDKYYLAVEGNIGAGKSTLTRLWAEKFQARSVYENFADNPYLPEFYKNPESLAFQLEISFLAERFSQLKRETETPNLFQPNIVSDYLFAKSFIFARNNLNEGEFSLFRKVFDIMHSVLPMPNLIVYIHRDVEHLKNNIKKRGREYEQEITHSYLKNIESGYFDYFRTILNVPILVINAEDIDFENNPHVFEAMHRFIFENEHQKGINTVELFHLI